MKYFKLKTLWVGLVLLGLGILFGKIEQTYYQYIDVNGVLRESWFFPLSIIFLLLGVVTLIIAFFMTIYLYWKQRNNANKSRNLSLDSQIEHYRNITKDYSNNLRKFIIVLGACDEKAMKIIADFGFEYQIEDSHKNKRTHVVSVLAPIQTIPDMVRALAQNNIAIYHVVLT